MGIIENIRTFKLFISGAITITELESYFECYNERYIEFEKDFYTTFINSNEEIRAEICSLLSQFNIPPRLMGKYFAQDLTVYQFFKQLVIDDEHSVQKNLITDYIVNQKWQGIWELIQHFAIAAIFVLPAFGVMLYPAFSFLYEFLIKTANLLPILGIVFTSISLIFNIYINHLYDHRPTFKIYRDDVFLLIGSAFSIAAKVTLIVAQSTLASFAAVLFIASALVDIVKEIFYLFELRRHFKNIPELSEVDHPAIYFQQHARHNYDYIKQRNALIINLIAALAITGSVIGCTFLPIGLLLTLCTCISVSVVYIIKKIALTYNEECIAEQLQTELKHISEQHQQDIPLEDLEKSVREDIAITRNDSTGEFLVNLATSVKENSYKFFSSSKDDVGVSTTATLPNQLAH